MSRSTARSNSITRRLARLVALTAAFGAACIEAPPDAQLDGEPPADAVGDGPLDPGDMDPPDLADDVADGDPVDVADAAPEPPDLAPPDAVAEPPMPDRDGDRVPDAHDPCPDVASRLPRDVDGDGAGDACDADDDGDGVLDVFDPCPWLADEAGPADCAADRDADGMPDAEDDCPTVPDPGDGPCPGPLQPEPWSRATTALLADGDGLIVGTRGGVLRLDADGVLLQRWTAVDGVGPEVTGLSRGEDGAIWVAHAAGLSVIRPDGLVLRAGEDAPREPVEGVVVADDGVWFTDARGLWRLDAAQRVRMGEPARALFVDGRGAPWRVDLLSVQRLHPPAEVVERLGPVGFLEGGAAGADPDEIWVFGARGIARVRDAGLHWIYDVGHPVYAALEHAGQIYLATADGVRRIDRDGRLLPGALPVDGAFPPLPPGEARAVAIDAAERLWVGGDGGLRQLDGVLSVFHGPELPCVTAVARFDGLLWLGTFEGLRVVDRWGVVWAVDGVLDRVTAITPEGESVWVGTEAGVTIFGPDQQVVDTLQAGVELPDAPVSAIAARDDEVWVATGGAGIVVGEPGAWRPLNVANGLVHDEVFALADDGFFMWIATPLGVQAWDHAQQALLPPGRPRVVPARDVAAAPGQPFVAGAAGVLTQLPDGQWVTLRRQIGGVPNEAGTDSTRALAFDGEHLWMLLDVNRRMTEGSLLRRSPDPLIPPTVETLWPLADLGLHRRAEIDMWWLGEELAIGSCGDRVERGGLWLIGGRGLGGIDTAPRRLPGGPGTRLTRGPAGWPMVVGPGPGGPFAAAIERGALVGHDPREIDAAPTACDAIGDDLWCVFADGSWGRRFGNGQWNRGTPQLPGQPPLELRDIALSAAIEPWIATDRGVLQVEGASVRLLQRQAGGLIDDDVRAVHVAGRRLYAATAAGVSIYDMDADRWFDIGVERLPAGSTRGLWSDDAGRLWVATDAGLAVFAADGGPLADAPAIDRLEGLAITGVVGDGDGRIYAVTAEGLYVLEPDGARRLFGPAYGLPGALDGRMVIDPEGDVWVGGADGVARLDPRDL